MFRLMTPGAERLELTPWDMEMCGIPRDYWGAQLAKIPEKASHRATVAKAVSEPAEFVNRGVGFVFAGRTGAGKTASACIIAKAVKAYGGTTWFSRADEVMTAIMEEWVRPGDEDVLQKDYWRSVNLWVVDDVGTALGSEQTKAALEREIRWRLSMRRSVIVTTNNEKGAMPFSEQVLRAMRERMVMIPVEDVGLSRAEVSRTTEWYQGWIGGGK